MSGERQSKNEDKTQNVLYIITADSNIGLKVKYLHLPTQRSESYNSSPRNLV